MGSERVNRHKLLAEDASLVNGYTNTYTDNMKTRAKAVGKQPSYTTSLKNSISNETK